MRIQRTVGLLSVLRFLRSERSVPLTDSPINVGGRCAPWQGSIGLHKCDYFLSTRRRNSWQLILKILLFGSTAISFGFSGNVVIAEDASASNLTINNDQGDDFVTGLRRIEDGSVISNSHTIKWRIFTDNGRDLFLKGKLDEAEKYFQAALQEAKEGFGLRDSHVASSCNNLAEIYRTRKAFDKAEPLYLEAINILEESFGTNDIRVGATLHNLGQFYFLQRKVEQAQKCYERALKIEGRVLGFGHTDYANTMYHLGMVLYLQGKEKDSEALLRESIRILEENGLGETITCARRMRYLTQMLLKSERLVEAENLQRKILHVLEISKGWNFLETIVAAEGLAMTLQSLERLEESQELLERCVDARRNILPHGD
ncbi:kinesin light chain 3 isoform X1 [Dendrobium catenatum]|uniref:kinesin light chain 3 isoform X1 n=1 Tax=Dendrobium catenatum TaxID=906689 RepID=UPI0009F4E20B|nr:kinesin light chain 3 isoform X1 [Dendrobium catenatum]